MHSFRFVTLILLDSPMEIGKTVGDICRPSVVLTNARIGFEGSSLTFAGWRGKTEIFGTIFNNILSWRLKNNHGTVKTTSAILTNHFNYTSKAVGPVYLCVCVFLVCLCLYNNF